MKKDDPIPLKLTPEQADKFVKLMIDKTMLREDVVMPIPYEIARTNQEVDEVLEKALEQRDKKGRTKRPDMTYEEGVIDALDWIVGHIDDNPMEDSSVERENPAQRVVDHG